MGTGIASAINIAKEQEIIVKLGTMTSSPGANSNAATAEIKAVVPLLTATEYCLPQ
jgi:hypothetical protein